MGWLAFKKRKIVAIALLFVLTGAGTATVLFRPRPIPSPPSMATLDANAARGAYLATVGNCRTCHTAPGGKAYAGGVEFQTQFGTLYSTNITNDAEHGIGAWSFEDFHAAMKHGLRPDGTHLYPAFPYTSFAKLTDSDMASLYLYMKTVTASARPNRANAMGFPFDNRSLLHFWKRLFHDTDTFAADPSKSAEWNRGAYLVAGLAHCGACHTPRNILGAEKASNRLAGGIYYDKVLTGEYKKWSAVDLTPSSDGLGAWSKDDITRYLLKGQSSRAVVHGPMNEVVMNSTRHLEDGDARAIATYLKGIPADENLIDWPLLGSNFDEGKVIYTVHCGTCHLPNGAGDPVLGVQLGGNAIVQADDPASLINVILYGPQLPPPPFVSKRTKMPAFGKRLSDADIAAVSTYLRNSFGNSGSAVTTGDVEKQR